MIIEDTSGEYYQSQSYISLNFIDIVNSIEYIDIIVTGALPKIPGAISKYCVNAEHDLYSVNADIDKYFIKAETGEIMKIIKGNTMILGFSLVDGDGDTITDLSDCTNIKFQIKVAKTGSAAISKTLGSGVTADKNKNNVDTTGSIRVAATATETNALTANSYYYIAVQLEYSGNTQEVYITENGVIIDQIYIEQDIIQ